ncbi:MAG: endonuclease/exonuclease/phosphatase family protein [Cellulomonadaceae bacterium]
MSYNLKSLQLDEDAAARVIRSAAPDVVCVQEAVRWLRGPRRTARFARRVGMTAVVSCFAARGTAVFVRDALLPAVVSARGVAIDSRLRRLRRGWPTSRGYAEVRMRIAGGQASAQGAGAEGAGAGRAGAGRAGAEESVEVLVLSVHMSIVPAMRSRHLPRLRQVVDDAGPGRVVLAADLNEEPGAPAWRAFIPPLRDAGPADVPTFPARHPRRRIDALLVGADLQVTQAQVLTGADTARASDHCPVLATIAPIRPGR